MSIYLVGFEGEWQERFDEPEEAIAWAEEVAATGRVVEVVRRRFGFHKFIAGFPESERDALEMRWKTAWVPWWAGDNAGGGGSDYGSAYGGHHGGGHGGGGGHHGGGH